MSYAYVYPSRQERAISGAFALGMHALFLALLVFGVTWQKKLEPQANIVDLYAALAPEAKPIELPPEPAVQPQPAPAPVAPPPPVKAESKPAPKPEVAKPDIAMKEKAEKDRRVLEEKRKEAKKREEAAKVAALQQQQQAEAQRAAREQEEALRRAAEQAAAAQTQTRLRNEYIEKIRAKIKSKIFLPPNLKGNPEAEFDVVLLPGGDVLEVKLKRSSGIAAYDRAVEIAIGQAQPLPLPPDPALFKEFRELNLKFRPQE